MRCFAVSDSKLPAATARSPFDAPGRLPRRSVTQRIAAQHPLFAPAGQRLDEPAHYRPAFERADAGQISPSLQGLDVEQVLRHVADGAVRAGIDAVEFVAPDRPPMARGDEYGWKMQ
jgi:hypothetical protein